MKAHSQIVKSTILQHRTKVCDSFVGYIYSIIKQMQLKTFLTYHQSPSHFSLAIGSNGELAILDTLLKDSNGYISVLNDNQ